MATKKAKSSGKLISAIFEDESIVIFDKPANLLVIPTAKNEMNTLVNIVNEQYAKDFLYKLHPCHRIDKETSGLIVFAKGKQNQKKMMDVFKAKGISKHYTAFVHGRLKQGSGAINTPVRSFDKAKYNRKASLRPALTKYKVLETLKDFSIIDVQIVTGRTNQIRLHFKSIGHPLVGDRKYSFARDYKLKFRRAALHASKLSFKHPVTNKKIELSSKLPRDMEEFIGKYSN